MWVLVLVVSLFTHHGAYCKFVSSVLNANWKHTPLYLEASEFVAEESNSLFFKYLSQNDGVIMSTDKDEYSAAVSTLEGMFPAVTISLLKLSLSLRQYSPRVLMFNKISRGVFRGVKCKEDAAPLQINSLPTCLDDATPLETLISSVSSSSRDPVKLLKYDHVYRDNPDTPQVILYCDIRDHLSRCMETHEALMLLADSGKVTYVFRHRYTSTNEEHVRLSGYGVELAVKSTEYTTIDDTAVTESEKQQILKTREEEEVKGFRFGYLKDKYPDHVENLNKFRDYLIEEKDAMKPLKAWEISDLGYQAAQRIASAPVEESLNVLKKYSQNLPSLARSLSRTKLEPNVRTEIKSNQKILEKYNVHPGSNVLLLNGMLIDLETPDPFILLGKLRSESKAVGALMNTGVSTSSLNKLLKSDIYKSGAKYGIDIRDESVFYINDLEVDRAYKYWPSSISELLRPSYPGMLKHIRKNIHNLVLVIKPSDPSTKTLLELIGTLLEHQAPLRIGVVFVSDQSEDELSVDTLLPAAVSYLSSSNGRSAVQEFLVELSQETVTMETLKAELSNIVSVKVSESFVAENAGLLSAGNSYRSSSGVSTGQVIVNGIVLEDLHDIEEQIISTLQSYMPKLQRAVYLQEVTDQTNVLDWFMEQRNILSRYNSAVVSPTSYRVQLGDLAQAGGLYTDMENILENSRWVGNSSASVSMIFVVGMDGSSDDTALISALAQSYDKLDKSRITFMFTKSTDVSYRIWIILNNSLDFAKDLTTLLSSNTLPEWLQKLADDSGMRKTFDEIVRIHKAVAHSVLHVATDSHAVVVNGRVISPLPNATPPDVQLIQDFELKSGAEQLSALLPDQNSDVIMKVASVLTDQESVSRITFPDLSTEYSAVVLPGEGPFQVEAVLDPLSKPAQQISQILQVLLSSKLIKLTVVLNPREKLSEMPLQRFYRYVMDNELRFGEDDAVSGDKNAVATFTDLLPHLLLTMSLHTPINWMVASTYSPHDLDNIRLSEVEHGVYAEYTLDSLVIEGHSHDNMRYNSPTKGLQYVLTDGNINYDTIVMANLGYFQLKAGPGVWSLSLRDGPSKDIYKIVGVEGPGTLEPNGDVTIAVGDLTSTFITVDATKKDGMGHRSVSEENVNAKSNDDGGIWDSLKSMVGSGSGKISSVNETINIFSVASGHLYERMLGIMMQSVLAHTKNPVKFWFLKNYLSPKFISSVPTLAKALGCEIEFVQYQWPSWLQAQTEKQRIIWGYKILFLDVLFPLDVKKFIFVDADQIVRADMKELIDLDLKGAPYGYTPFCDDKPEMDGFRFWKQGYWSNHLMGRAYHISALYVVDLQRFRLISAGDRLRGQYQGLSQDPNSLANLDQDLPNNMIHHVPIFSLPQEWLWCETWCSDQSKAYAKTIDLCNNPLTKEPKLERAMRIAPEWKDYDRKLKEILENTQSKGSKETPSTNKHTEL